MKVNKFFSLLSLAAVALIATGCQDTDAQIDIKPTTAPKFVSASPDNTDALLFGYKTIQIEFDKNIGFATKNTSKITLNGTPVAKASVIGISNVLTIETNVDFTEKQVLHIPAGLIVGPQKLVYEKDIDITWQPSELTGDNPAVIMTKKLGWGWNLGNHFDTSDVTWGYWDGATPTAATFQTVAAAGGKTVRIPVTWTCHMDATNTIDAAYLDEVAGVVDLAIAAGLNVILNTHHDSFETDLGNAANNDSIARVDSALIATLWTQVATKFAAYGENLIFETFNEVHAGDNWGGGSEEEYALLNKWNQYAVDAIRATGGNNATRWIGVAGYAANISLTANHFQLPNDPANRLMVSAHFYDPSNFTLSPESKDGYTEWGHTAASGKSSGDNEENYVEDALKTLQQKYIANNIPVYIGEYGCVIQTSERSNLFRNYYLEYVCRTAYLCNLPVMMWDNNSIGGGNEKHGVFSHSDGSYINGQEQMVKTMIKAATSDDKSYTLESIYNNAPK